MKTFQQFYEEAKVKIIKLRDKGYMTRQRYYPKAHKKLVPIPKPVDEV
tara:strand:- start:101 stop:244 length:144 start_codon:yes stop_codon:yes gene_type:complete